MSFEEKMIVSEDNKVCTHFHHLVLCSFFFVRLHNLVTQKQQDKQNLVKMEQKVKQERETRSTAENQLREERKSRKIEEAAARAMLIAAASPSR